MNCLVACSTSKAARALAPLPNERTSKAPAFNQRIEISIPLALAGAHAVLNSEIYRPNVKIEPRTLVIVVPGSNHVSRRGEVSGDGITNYPSAIELYPLWAKALSEQGLFVLTYDKRSCNALSSKGLCANNPHKDIDEEGIVALARDLDRVYDFAVDKMGTSEPYSIFLLAQAQGAQVVALSERAKNAQGIILLSPIAGPLESIWVDGLTRAHQGISAGAKKTRLLNQAESTKAFFASFSKGLFSESSHVRGASIKFWRSWMDTSKNTVKLLLAKEKPTLMLFSAKDVFSSLPYVNRELSSHKIKHQIAIKNIDNIDINFINNATLSAEAVREALNFIKTKKAAAPAGLAPNAPH